MALNKETANAEADDSSAIGLIDWAMLILAVASVALLLWEMLTPLPAEQRRLVLQIDLAVCALFAAEFTWRWQKAGWPRSFLLRNWYEILGMIPVSHPAIRGFRLIRLVRILVVLSRFGRAADRAFGQEFTYRLIRRFKNAVVEAIGDTVTLYVLDEVSYVLDRGRYTQNVARALERHSAEIEETVRDSVMADASMGALRRLPFFEDVLAASTKVTQRIIVEFLDDERTDELIADILRENLQQIRAAIEEHERVGTPHHQPFAESQPKP